jgi:hypothetical protein
VPCIAGCSRDHVEQHEGLGRELRAPTRRGLSSRASISCASSRWPTDASGRVRLGEPVGQCCVCVCLGDITPTPERRERVDGSGRPILDQGLDAIGREILAQRVTLDTSGKAVMAPEIRVTDELDAGTCQRPRAPPSWRCPTGRASESTLTDLPRRSHRRRVLMRSRWPLTERARGAPRISKRGRDSR